MRKYLATVCVLALLVAKAMPASAESMASSPSASESPGLKAKAAAFALHAVRVLAVELFREIDRETRKSTSAAGQTGTTLRGETELLVPYSGDYWKHEEQTNGGSTWSVPGRRVYARVGMTCVIEARVKVSRIEEEVNAREKKVVLVVPRPHLTVRPADEPNRRSSAEWGSFVFDGPKRADGLVQKLYAELPEFALEHFRSQSSTGVVDDMLAEVRRVYARYYPGYSLEVRVAE